MIPFSPSLPVAGNDVSATLIRQLIAEIRASRVIAGPGVAVRRTPQGTHVSAKAVPAAGGESGSRFWVFSKETGESGEQKSSWKRKFLQIGMRIYDLDNSDKQFFKDETDGSDGYYHVSINLGTQNTEVEVRKGRNEGLDMSKGEIYFYLGEVKDGKLSVPFVPVIYINL